jgi:hypothetical protein
MPLTYILNHFDSHFLVAKMFCGGPGKFRRKQPEANTLLNSKSQILESASVTDELGNNDTSLFKAQAFSQYKVTGFEV